MICWFLLLCAWKAVKIKDQNPLVLKLSGRWSPGEERKGEKLAALLTAMGLFDWSMKRTKNKTKGKLVFYELQT